MPCFSLADTERQMSIRTAEVRPYGFYCFGKSTARSTVRSRRRLGSSRVCQGYCRSRYDAEPEIGDEDSASLKTYLDASRMYD